MKVRTFIQLCNDSELSKKSVVIFTANIGNHLKSVGEPDLRDFTQGRVRLFRGCGVNPGTNASPLRAILKGRALALCDSAFSALSDQLVNGGHGLTFLANIEGERIRPPILGRKP